MPSRLNPTWPALTTSDRDHLEHIALPLGGIGTGTVSLGGRGQLRDWEIVNRPAKGFGPPNAFFAIWCKEAGSKQAITRCVEGALPEREHFGARGSTAANHGLPRFAHCEFAAAYPLGQVMLRDKGVPVSVRLEAFNPLIPGDSDRSGMPVAVLRYVVTNTSKAAVDVALCGSMENFIGRDGSPTQHGPAGNVNTFREAGKLAGIHLTSNGVPAHVEQYGDVALALLDAKAITHRTAWVHEGWGVPLLDFWDDFSGDGKLDAREQSPGDVVPTASLATRFKLKPGQSRTVTYLIGWRFPNRMTWTPDKAEECCPDGQCDTVQLGTPAKPKVDPNNIGNYYCTQFADAWQVVCETAKQLPALERDTVSFVSALCDSDLPAAVKEAALFNVSTLRTQTCFRTADGWIFGWEGCDPHSGCCYGSCTHVWNYEHATALLFGDLARRMRDIEFLHATDERGCMSFRVNLPLEKKAQQFNHAAADGQMGCLMKLYREWQLCGDDAWLKKLYPAAKRTIEYCWIPGGWDADRDGVMEGCQHNTMDVEYFGPNPQMTGWYLGALRAGEEMATRVGDSAFAATCRELFTRGKAWMDEHLFNGEYYEHIVQPPKRIEDVAPGLRIGMGSKDLANPLFQLGKGCLVDQLVGQYFAHVVGLGYLHDKAKVHKTLQSILKHNRLPTFESHFNNMRSYAMGKESALLMASYPHGERPASPFPYFNEVMTGFEYTAAVGMLYEGMEKQGLQCIADIRERYTGQNRNPFDEAECGHHYARAMASWAAVLALTGFHYHAADGAMTFAKPAKKVTWFWSTGDAWGTVKIKPGKRSSEVTLTVLAGELKLQTLCIKGAGEAKLDKAKPLKAGKSVTLSVA